MKNIKWLVLAILLFGLVLAAVACGGEKATSVPEATQAQPAATSTQPPAATKTPEPTPTTVATVATEPTSAPAAGLDSSSLVTEKSLDSYRSTTVISIKGTTNGKTVEESIEMLSEATRNPSVQHISMTTASTENVTSTGTIEIYQAEGVQYLNMGGQWFSTPVTDTTDLASQGLTADQMLNETCGWKDKGTEDLDGVKVEHWTLNKAGMDSCAGAGPILGMDKVTNGGGDLYIAVDGRYIAKLQLFYEGTGITMLSGTTEQAPVDEGRMDISFTITDVNQKFTIDIPAEAKQSSTLPEDLPIPADAEGVSQMFGMIVFSSVSTPQQLNDFYKTEMPKNGWTEESSAEFSGTFTIEFSKEARTASFMISPDTSTGKTQVLITIKEQ